MEEEAATGLYEQGEGEDKLVAAAAAESWGD